MNSTKVAVIEEKRGRLVTNMRIKHIYNPINTHWLKIFGVLLCLSFFTHEVNAQVYYYYDDNGNRISSSASHHSAERRKDTSKIKIYPNPTNGEVNVSISTLDKCRHANIYIMDGTGNLLATQEATSTLTTIDLTSYKEGIYYLRVNMCDEQSSCKIVKVNSGSGVPSSTQP